MGEKQRLVQFGDIRKKITKKGANSKILPQIKFTGTELLPCLNLAFRVAPLDTTVLITGETGVGKENIARLIHEQSARFSKELVVIDCSAITETLLMSTIFGHKKGAFTGAVEDKKGYFEIANGGTVFLDEIGELPIDTQRKLLRILEQGTFTSIGETTPRKTNVRIIAATNKNLANEVKKGNFRKDLFYRLNHFPIHIPPLRERSRDIPYLVEHFKELFLRNNELGIVSISPETIQRMQEYGWPGNVRELKSVIERVLIIHQDQDEILPKHLGDSITAQQDIVVGAKSSGETKSVVFSSNTSGLFVYRPITMEEFECVAVCIALFESNGIQTKAGEVLGVSKRTMHYKVNKYEIDPKNSLSRIEHLRID